MTLLEKLRDRDGYFREKDAESLKKGKYTIGNRVKTFLSGRYEIVDFETEVQLDNGLFALQMDDFCPIKIGHLLQTENPENPAITYPGTTWHRVIDKFILATKDEEEAGQEGGSKHININNLDPFEIKAHQDSHGHEKGTMNITGETPGWREMNSHTPQGAFGYGGSSHQNNTSGSSGSGSSWCFFDASETWSGETNLSQPLIHIDELGKGEEYLPPFYKLHMWIRRS